MLNARLAGGDRQRLDAHLSAIRDLEQRLSAPVPTCAPPGRPGAVDLTQDDNEQTIGRLHMDLMAAALACDLTRVASIQFSVSRSPIVFGSISSNYHHGLSHDDQNPASIDALVKINAFYASQLAYLLGKLEAIPEGTGTVLDNTIVLWGNELGTGRTHSHDQVPFVLAGNAGGYFRTGRFVNCGARPHNDLLISLCNAFGIADTTFGNPAYCTGPLAMLR